MKWTIQCKPVPHVAVTEKKRATIQTTILSSRLVAKLEGSAVHVAVTTQTTRFRMAVTVMFVMVGVAFQRPLAANDAERGYEMETAKEYSKNNCGRSCVLSEVPREEILAAIERGVATGFRKWMETQQTQLSSDDALSLPFPMHRAPKNARDILVKANCKTFRDVLMYGRRQLRQCKGVGRCACYEIENAFETIGKAPLWASS